MSFIFCEGLTMVCSPWNNYDFQFIGSYNTVSNMRYQHLTINHQLRFRDLVIYTTTNHVDLM